MAICRNHSGSDGKNTGVAKYIRPLISSCTITSTGVGRPVKLP